MFTVEGHLCVRVIHLVLLTHSDHLGHPVDHGAHFQRLALDGEKITKPSWAKAMDVVHLEEVSLLVLKLLLGGWRHVAVCNLKIAQVATTHCGDQVFVGIEPHITASGSYVKYLITLDARRTGRNKDDDWWLVVIGNQRDSQQGVMLTDIVQMALLATTLEEVEAGNQPLVDLVDDQRLVDAVAGSAPIVLAVAGSCACTLNWRGWTVGCVVLGTGGDHLVGIQVLGQCVQAVHGP